MKISIVIPTYNRALRVEDAIESSLVAFSSVPVEHEVIVVDDASTDDTVQQLQARFASEIANDTLRVMVNDVNRGVTGSRNAGYEIATGDWVVFLDSDDVLLPGVGNAVIDVLDTNPDKPIVFFRCRDDRGNPVGVPLGRDLVVGLADFIESGTRGESLPVVNRRIVAEQPYVEALKGYEGFAYCRIISRHGAALVSPVVARCYDLSGRDRRSAFWGMLKRMLILAHGHRLLLREFGAVMSGPKRMSYQVKALIYSIVGTLHGMVGGVQE